MIQKLEQQKKLISILFFLVSLAVLLPFIISSRNDLVVVLLSTILAAHLLIALIFWIKGLVLAAMVLTYYLLFVFVTALGVVLELYAPAFAFITRPALIILIVFLIVAFPVPRHVRDFINSKLNPGSQHAQDTPASQYMKMVFGTNTENNYSLATFNQFKKLAAYIDKSYSLASCSLGQRRLRLIVGWALIGIGLLFLMISLNSEDSATNYVYSWVFWSFIGGLVLIIIGPAVIFAGFFRSFIALTICGLLVLGGYNVDQLAWAAARHMDYSLNLLIILLIIAALSVFIIRLARYRRRYTGSLSFYQRNQQIVGADLYLRNFIPIKDYIYLITISLSFSQDPERKNLQLLTSKLLGFSKMKKLLVAGISFNQESLDFKIYIYCDRGQRTEQLIHRFLKRNWKGTFSSSITRDEQGHVYYDELYPSPEQLIEMTNKAIIADLELENFDFQIERHLVFQFNFADRQAAHDFVDFALANGFEKAIYVDNQEQAEKHHLAPQYYNLAFIQTTMRIGLDRLNLVCKEISVIASEKGGQFFKWQLGALSDD
jgi:hypothetical protein